jgi:uncharacterized membrane protein
MEKAVIMMRLVICGIFGWIESGVLYTYVLGLMYVLQTQIFS